MISEDTYLGSKVTFGVKGQINGVRGPIFGVKGHVWVKGQHIGSKVSP